MHVHVTQHIASVPDRIGTENAIVMESIKTGEAKGYEVAKGAVKPKTDAEIQCERLTKELAAEKEESAGLRRRVEELEARLEASEGRAGPRQHLAEALMTDAIVNGE